MIEQQAVSDCACICFLSTFKFYDSTNIFDWVRIRSSPLWWHHFPFAFSNCLPYFKNM